MNRVIFVLVALSMTLPPALAIAGEMDHQHAAAGSSALDPVKKLAGEWVGKAGHGDEKMDATVTYRVTAGGSAVIETQFPGSEHEMVTLYTVEKGALMLTHYCAIGNQPRMKARKSGAANELVFDFAGGAGINPGKDQFMHDAKLTFVDDDHLRCEWSNWKGGKQADAALFELERKK